MRSVGRRTAEADLAAIDPPASLSAFGLTEIPPVTGAETLPWADFDVHCKACGRNGFHVGWFPAATQDSAENGEFLPADTSERPPHRLKCSYCQTVDTIFDARTDGYNGLLCGGCCYESGEIGETFTDAPYKVSVSVTYNITLSELQELASEAVSIKPTDLFDWITIVATPIGSGARLELSYECA